MKPTDALPHPPDWRTETVGKAVEIRRGVSWAKSEEHDTRRVGTFPVLRIGNVQERLQLDELLFVSGIPDKAAVRKRVSRGWVLVVGSNGNRQRVGNGVLIREDTDFLFASFLIAARPKDGSGLTPGFFYRWLMSPQVQSYLSASSEGTTGLRNLSHSFFRAMAIPFPATRAEQDGVVAVLDAVDAVTDQVTAEVESARNVKRAMSQALFSRGAKGEELKKTAVGIVPESWDVVTVRSVVHEFQYGLSVAMQADGVLPILRMGNIQAGDVEFDSLKYVTLAERVYAPYVVHRGDVLFNRTNSQEHVGKVGIYRRDEPAVFASYLIRLVPDRERIDPYYLGQVLNSYPAQCRIKRYATPGVQQVNVNATNLSRVLIPIPVGKDSLDEQREIAAVLEEADTKIRSYRPVLASLRALKQSLVGDLVSGATRIRDRQSKIDDADD